MSSSWVSVSTEDEEEDDSLIGSPPTVGSFDLSDLHMSFAQQETLLGQLKGVLRSNEAKLVSKEKEVKNYAVRLKEAKIGKRDTSSPSESNFIPRVINRQKIQGLKEELEDAKSKEMELIYSQSTFEKLVEGLKAELAERDIIIASMSESTRASSPSTRSSTDDSFLFDEFEFDFESDSIRDDKEGIILGLRAQLKEKEAELQKFKNETLAPNSNLYSSIQKLEIDLQIKNKSLQIFEIEREGNRETERRQNVKIQELESQIHRMSQEIEEEREKTMEDNCKKSKEYNTLLRENERLSQALKLNNTYRQTSTSEILSKEDSQSENDNKYIHALAECEEEKGQLQLKLMDFDELTTSYSALESCIEHHEKALREANNRERSQEAIIVKLREQILEVSNQLDSQKTLNEKITAYQEEWNDNYQKAHQSKITCEIRAVVLEEEKEKWEKEKKDLETRLKTHEQESKELEHLKKTMENRCHQEHQQEKLLMEKCEEIRVYQIEMTQLEKYLTEKNEELTNCLSVNHRHVTEKAESLSHIQELERVIESKDAEIKDLTNAVFNSGLQIQIDELMITNENYKYQLDEKNKENQEFVESLSRYRVECNEAQERNETILTEVSFKFQEEIHQRDILLLELKNEMEALVTQIHFEKEKVVESDKEIETMRDRLSDSKKEIDRLSYEYEIVKKLHEETKESHAIQSSEYETEKKLLKEATEKIDRLSYETETCKTLLEETQESQTIQSLEYETVKKLLEEANEKIDRLSYETETCKTLLEETQESHAIQSLEYETVKKLLEESQEKLSTLFLEYETTMKLLKDFQEQGLTDSSDTETSRKLLEDSQKRLKTLSLEYETVKKLLKESQKQSETHSSDNETTKKYLENSQKTIDTLSLEYETVKKLLEDSQEKLSTLSLEYETLLKESEKQRQIHTSETETSRKYLDESQKKLETLSSEYETSQKYLEDSQKKLNILSSEYETSQKLLTDSQKQIMNLSSEVKEKENQRKYTSGFEETQEKNDEQIVESKKQITYLTNVPVKSLNISALVEKEEDSEQYVEKFMPRSEEEELRDYKVKCATLEESLETLKSTLKDKESSLLSISKECNSLRSASPSLVSLETKDKNEALREKAKKLLVKCKGLERLLKEKESFFEETISQYKALILEKDSLILEYKNKEYKEMTTEKEDKKDYEEEEEESICGWEVEEDPWIQGDEKKKLEPCELLSCKTQNTVNFDESLVELKTQENVSLNEKVIELQKSLEDMMTQKMKLELLNAEYSQALAICQSSKDELQGARVLIMNLEKELAELRDEHQSLYQRSERLREDLQEREEKWKDEIERRFNNEKLILESLHQSSLRDLGEENQINLKSVEEKYNSALKEEKEKNDSYIRYLISEFEEKETLLEAIKSEKETLIEEKEKENGSLRDSVKCYETTLQSQRDEMEKNLGSLRDKILLLSQSEERLLQELETYKESLILKEERNLYLERVLEEEKRARDGFEKRNWEIQVLKDENNEYNLRKEEREKETENNDYEERILDPYKEALAQWQEWGRLKTEELEFILSSSQGYQNKIQSLEKELEEQSLLVHQIKIKNIEVEDLTESLERLASEKNELIEEMRELRKINYRNETEEDLTVTNEHQRENMEIKSMNEELTLEIQRLRTEILSVQNVHESLTGSLKSEIENFKLEILNYQNQILSFEKRFEVIESQKTEWSLQQLEEEEKDKKIKEIQSQSESQLSEIESLKHVIGEWNEWGSCKNAEYENLLRTLMETQSSLSCLQEDKEREEYVYKEKLKDMALRNTYLEKESETWKSSQILYESKVEQRSSSEENTGLGFETKNWELEESIRENRELTSQWKRHLENLEKEKKNGGEESFVEDFRHKNELAFFSVAALQVRVEELTLEVTKLLKERDTLQLKLSNVMRQFERQKESSSRAVTPIPWLETSVMEIDELKNKIEELGKLNYALDIQLQKERKVRETMQDKLNSSPQQPLSPRGGHVLHL